MSSGAKELHPLTFGQRWLLHVSSLAPELSRPVQRLYRLGTDASTSRIVRALQYVVTANEALRLQLVETPAGWRQRFTGLEPEVAGVRVTGATARHRSAYALQSLIEDARKPFDVTCDPALVARVAACDGELFLALTIDHLAADEAAFDLLETQLEAAYGLDDDAPPPADGAFVRYVEREQRFATNAAASLAYWRRKLAGAPLATGATAEAWVEGRRAKLTVQGDALQEFIADCRSASCSPAHVVNAALLLVLHGIDGRTDIVLNTPVSNRTGVEDAAVIGNISMLLHPRFVVDSAMTTRDFLRDVRGRLLEAMVHRHYDYAALVKALFAEAEDRKGEIDFGVGCSFVLQKHHPTGLLRDRLGREGAATPHVPSGTFSITARQSSTLVLDAVWDRNAYPLTETELCDALAAGLGVVRDRDVPVGNFVRERVS